MLQYQSHPFQLALWVAEKSRFINENLFRLPGCFFKTPTYIVIHFQDQQLFPTLVFFLTVSERFSEVQCLRFEKIKQEVFRRLWGHQHCPLQRLHSIASWTSVPAVWLNINCKLMRIVEGSQLTDCPRSRLCRARRSVVVEGMRLVKLTVNVRVF